MTGTGILLVLLAAVVGTMFGHPDSHGFNFADGVAVVVLYTGLAVLFAGIAIYVWKALS